MHKRLRINDTFKNKLPLASLKDTYPVYYQGVNLGENYSSLTSSNDRFGLLNYVITMPDVIRVHVLGTGFAPDVTYYQAFGPYFATKFANTRICVTWGDAGIYGGGSRYIPLANPGQSLEFPYVAPADMIAGRILTFMFHWPFQLPYGDELVYTPKWEFDHPDFVARYPRIDKSATYIYTQAPVLTDIGAQIVNEQVNSTGVYSTFTPSLASMGWTPIKYDLSNNPLPYNTFDGIVTDFFGL